MSSTDRRPPSSLGSPSARADGDSSAGREDGPGAGERDVQTDLAAGTAASPVLPGDDLDLSEVDGAVRRALDGLPAQGGGPNRTPADESVAGARALGNLVADAEQVRTRVGVTAEAIAPWAERLVRVLDDGIRVPGTNFRFGLDPILGFFFPTVGDVATGLGAASLLVLALQNRVPTVVIGRMIVNLVVDTMLGSIPIVGDVFDLFFRANRKNLDLIERYRDDPNARPGALDYALVGTGFTLAAASILLPLLFAYLLAGLGLAFFANLFGN